MSLEQYETKESDIALTDMASLAMQNNIPKTHIELGNLLWKAFNLGKEYRDKGGKE